MAACGEGTPVDVDRTTREGDAYFSGGDWSTAVKKFSAVIGMTLVILFEEYEYVQQFGWCCLEHYYPNKDQQT